MHDEKSLREDRNGETGNLKYPSGKEREFIYKTLVHVMSDLSFRTKDVD